MTINTGNTKEQSNGLNLEDLTRKLNTNPIKFYVERKKNYGHFLNDQEIQILQSQNKLYLHRIISGGIKTEIKKINKDYDISGMIDYLSNQIYTSEKTPEPNSAHFSFLLIHQFYKDIYEEKNKLPNLINNIGNKCSNLLKSLTNRF